MYQEDQSVTVVIPSFNHEKFIADTVRSIWAQTHPFIEIIVVDDCSDDESISVLNGLQRESRIPLHIIPKDVNKGVCHSLNVGIKLATGKYICFLASDDLYPPTRVARHVQVLSQINDAGIGGCCGPLEIIDSHGVSTAKYKAIPVETAVPQLDAIKRRLGCSLQGSTFYTEVAREVSFDESLYFEDWDFFIRLSQYYRIVPLRDASCLYRVHLGGANRNASKMVEARASILLKHESCQYFINRRYLRDLKKSVFLANSQSYFNVMQYKLAWIWIAKLFSVSPLMLSWNAWYIAALSKRSLSSALMYLFGKSLS